MTADFTELDIPAQGICRKLSHDELVDFFDKEVEFWARNTELGSGNITFGQWGLDSLETLIRTRSKAVSEIRSELTRGEEKPGPYFASFVSSAQSLQVVVGQGLIGNIIDDARTSDPPRAKWILALYSASYKTGDPWLTAFRAAALGSPAIASFGDIVASQSAKQTALDTKTQIEQALHQISEVMAQKTALLAELERLYRDKLSIEEPAKFWLDTAAQKRTAWRFWLSAFAVLVLAPTAVAIYHWDIFSAAILHLTTGTGTISLTGLAAISVPALFYAWLLKNVSRMFLQNLNLSDDAAHRRALAICYLGLAANPNTGITEAERAIMLNALFRALPQHGEDDGPPAGLLELIKSR